MVYNKYFMNGQMSHSELIKAALQYAKHKISIIPVAIDKAPTTKTWKENQEGLNEAYYSHCSFRSPTQPVPAEINPRNVLNRLGHRGLFHEPRALENPGRAGPYCSRRETRRGECY